jgi:hypothetical protein
LVFQAAVVFQAMVVVFQVADHTPLSVVVVILTTLMVEEADTNILVAGADTSHLSADVFKFQMLINYCDSSC